MKIPYHQEKIKHAFQKYGNEFTQCVQEHVDEHQSERKGFSVFKSTYPLFVLIESLNSSDYFYDPSKELLLQEALRHGEEDIVIEVARNLNLRDLNGKETLLKEGMLKQHFTPYFQELYSDMLMLLNNYYMNNYRGCYISLRSVLEDLYRHLYYKDHPQEFLAVTSGYTEYELGLNPKFFREYLSRTSYLFGEEKDMDLFGKNYRLYKDTSVYIHASSLDSLSQFESNASFCLKKNEAEAVEKITKEIVSISVTFLVCVHRNYFVRFNDYTKSLIFDIYDKNIKHKFRKFANI